MADNVTPAPEGNEGAWPAEVAASETAEVRDWIAFDDPDPAAAQLLRDLAAVAGPSADESFRAQLRARLIAEAESPGNSGPCPLGDGLDDGANRADGPSGPPKR
jgi:hypothetical protein